jgi:subtilisin family serine protease
MRLLTHLAAIVLVLVLLSGTLFADSRCVVGFKGEPDKGLLAKYGTVITVVDGLEVGVVILSEKRIADLRAESGVAWVEEDACADAVAPGNGKGPPPKDEDPPEEEDPPADTQVVPWGVDRVWGSNSKPTVDGSGVKIGINDTGIDLDHEDLAANIQGEVNFVNSRKSGNDDNGHGTHVAGTVAGIDNLVGVIGVAGGADIYAIKTLDRRGSGFFSDVAAGIDWAVANGLDIVNMSLGGGKSTVMEVACENAEGAGLLLIAASGNSGDGSTATTEISYPAAEPSVVAVGATNSSDNLASFSSTGPHLEVSGPGVSVESAWAGGGYKTISGTSMACPHAVGLAALIWEEMASPTGSSVRSELQKRVRDLGPDGHDNGYGYGVVYYP